MIKIIAPISSRCKSDNLFLLLEIRFSSRRLKPLQGAHIEMLTSFNLIINTLTVNSISNSLRSLCAKAVFLLFLYVSNHNIIRVEDKNHERGNNVF